MLKMHENLLNNHEAHAEMSILSTSITGALLDGLSGVAHAVGDQCTQLKTVR